MIFVQHNIAKRRNVLHNYKMTVQYDGTRYSGWQRQGNTSSTIQGRLEQTLSRLLEEPVFRLRLRQN